MALGILGGIGQGIQRGAQSMREQEAFEQNKQFRQQQMDMQRQQSEHMNKLREMEEAQLDVWKNYADKDMNDAEVFESFAKDITPHMNAQQIQAMQQARNGLLQQVGADAVDRFLYNSGDLSGFQAAIDKKVPGATLSVSGNNIVLTRPDGRSQNFADVRGLAVMLKMPGVVERMTAAEAASVAGQKTKAEIEAQRALANQRNAVAAGKAGGYYDDDGRWVSVGGGTRSSGSGSPSAKKAEPEPEGGVLQGWDKSRNDLQSWVREGLPDSGIEQYGKDGKPSGYVTREQASQRVAHIMDQLYRANPVAGKDGRTDGLTIEGARQIALDMLRYELGQPEGKGTYQVQPNLNPATGEWETTIQTAAGEVVRVPSLFREPTPAAREEAESRWIARMVDDGTSAAVAQLMDDEEVRSAFIAARNDPDKMRRFEASAVATDPRLRNVRKRIETLYTHNLLPDLIIPDQALANARNERVKSRQPAPRVERQQSEPRPERSPEDHQRAEELGFKGVWSPGQVVADAASGVARGVGDAVRSVGQGVSGGYDSLKFDTALRTARLSKFGYAPAVEELAALIKKHPSLRNDLTEQEQFLLDFAADQAQSR